MTLSIFKNTFISMVTILALIVAVFGLCYPAFFTAHAVIVITAVMTFFLVTGFWFMVAVVSQNKNR
jgi:hypothetical protein